MLTAAIWVTLKLAIVSNNFNANRYSIAWWLANLKHYRPILEAFIALPMVLPLLLGFYLLLYSHLIPSLVRHG